MTPEHRLGNLIRIECGRRNWLCYHANVGSVMTIDGGRFDTGLPVGFPDLIILTDDGRALFVETKIKPRKPTVQQLEFHAILRDRGFSVAVCYDFDEFIKFIDG